MFKVWNCKIVVSGDAELPPGFDYPPRRAAINAVEEETKIISCFSGWGGSLTKSESNIVKGKCIRMGIENL